MVNKKIVKPAPYPNSDVAEGNAVRIFESLLDPQYARSDIRTRDKVPNVDGYIELTDEESIPIGKFEVQVKPLKKGKGEYTYSCSIKLAAYSDKTTLPVILVCVDVLSKKVFWKQITTSMPEFRYRREGGKSFSIRFSEYSDSIDQKGLYLQKWRDMVLAYQKIMRQYPQMSTDIANLLNVEGVAQEDITILQRFISSVNNLFDRDFQVLKKLLHPDTWQFGVGILDVDEKNIYYGVYKIPLGVPFPSLCRIDANTNQLLFETRNIKAVAQYSSTRDQLSKPEEKGAEFVLSQVWDVWKKRAFPVFGRLVASDVLFSFIDQYHCVLGIEGDRDQYKVSELDYAFNNYFFKMCLTFVIDNSSGNDRHVVLDLDALNDYLKNHHLEPRNEKKSIWFSVRSNSFPIRVALDALNHLTTVQEEFIQRPFWAKCNSNGGGLLWSGFSEDEVEACSIEILKQLIPQYSEFVAGNLLQFPHSPYLNNKTPVIFEYLPTQSEYDVPLWREYQVSKSNGNLPKYSVIVGTKAENDLCEKPMSIEIDGVQHECGQIEQYGRDVFFAEMPVLNLIYLLLENDISSHYGKRPFNTL